METPLDRDGLIQLMRRRGIRVTAQRLAVSALLASTREHLTAQEIFQRVREHFPHITIGTVYNTLETLARHGLIQPLAFPKGVRYDANTAPHANLVCLQCGNIEDAADDEGLLSRLQEQIRGRFAFQVLSQRMDFYGLCSRCASDAALAPL